MTSDTGEQSAPVRLSAEQGPMWDLLRSHDWSRTSLGAPETWPIALRTVLRAVLSSTQPMCLWWGPELRQFHNEAFLPMLGKRVDGAFGAPFRELWADAWEGVEPYVRSALSGQGASAVDLPLTLTRNGYPERTYWSFSYSPLHDDRGEIAGILNVTTETTRFVLTRQAQSSKTHALELALGEANLEIDEQRQAAEVKAVVQRELSHRLKNSYAMVQAIVGQTLRHSSSTEEASATISSRIQALAAAQDVLTRSIAEQVEIADVVKAALAPHQDMIQRIDVSGPRVQLSGQRVMGIALAVHELATNSAKYGGLSRDGGSARVSWNTEGPAFAFEWSEAGGPPVSAPQRRGFGSRLLERVIPSYFGGSASLDYRPAGLGYALNGVLAPVDVETGDSGRAL